MTTTSADGVPSRRFDVLRDEWGWVSALDWGALIAGGLAFAFSWLPYYSVHGAYENFSGSASSDAWNGGTGWVAAICALLAASCIGWPIVNTSLGFSLWPWRAAVAFFGAAVVLILIAGWAIPGPDQAYYRHHAGVAVNIDKGPAPGYWLSLFAAVVGLACAYRRQRVLRSEFGAV